MTHNCVQDTSSGSVASSFLLIACWFLVPAPVFVSATLAQPVQVEAVKRLSPAAPPFPVVESYLAVNPTDSDNLIASAMSTSANESVVYVSIDGGKTWRSAMHSGGEVFPGGDPMLVFDGNGRAYFTTIDPGLTVWHSVDGGLTWEGPATAGDADRYDDRQWVAVPRTPADSLLPVYGAAKTLRTVDEREQDVVVFTRSQDGGVSFSDPAFMPIGRGFLHTVSELRVSRTGTVLMPMLINYGRTQDGLIRGTMWILRSNDGGANWSEPHRISDRLSYGNDAGNRVWISLGVTSLAEDTSDGPHGGTLYVTWPEPVDDFLQIFLARSTDGGVTWSEPARVNREGRTSHLGTPMTAVNSDGVVAVTWNDRRHDPENLCFRHFVAVSRDGGRTFSAGTPVSHEETCPGAGSRWMNGGETQGLVALPDGSFRTTWSVGTRSNMSLWTAVIGVE